MNGLFLATAIALTVTGMPPHRPLDGNNDYSVALRTAQLSQQPLLVILENSSDATQCLSQDGAQEFSGRAKELLRGYEVCRVDVSAEYGQKVAESYGATEFPYCVITDETCQQIVYRGVGHFSPETWERTLENFRVASRAKTGKRHTVRKIDVSDVTRPKNNLETDLSDGLPYRQPFSHPNLDSAISASRKSQRGLVVYVTMPGCFYCQKMKAETLVDPSLKSTIRSGFESVIVNRVDEPRWVAKQNVTIFPTTLVLSPDGRVVDRVDGYVKASDLKSRLKSAKSAHLTQL